MQSSKAFFYQKRSRSNGQNSKIKDIYKSGSMQELDPESHDNQVSDYGLKNRKLSLLPQNYFQSQDSSPKSLFQTPLRYTSPKNREIQRHDRQKTEPSHNFQDVDLYGRLNTVQEHQSISNNNYNYNQTKSFEPKVRLNQRVRLLEPPLTQIKSRLKDRIKHLPLVFHESHLFQAEQNQGALTCNDQNRNITEFDLQKLPPLSKQSKSQQSPDQFGMTFQNPFFADAKMKISFYKPKIQQQLTYEYVGYQSMSITDEQNPTHPQKKFQEPTGYQSLNFPPQFHNPPSRLYSLEKSQSDRPVEFQGVVYRKKMKSRFQAKLF